MENTTHANIGSIKWLSLPVTCTLKKTSLLCKRNNCHIYKNVIEVASLTPQIYLFC